MLVCHPGDTQLNSPYTLPRNHSVSLAFAVLNGPGILQRISGTGHWFRVQNSRVVVVSPLRRSGRRDGTEGVRRAGDFAAKGKGLVEAGGAASRYVHRDRRATLGGSVAVRGLLARAVRSTCCGPAPPRALSQGAGGGRGGLGRVQQNGRRTTISPRYCIATVPWGRAEQAEVEELRGVGGWVVAKVKKGYRNDTRRQGKPSW